MWLAYAILASIIWGLNYALGERIFRRVSPSTMLGVQMLLGAIVFLSVSAFSRLREDLATLARERSTLLWFVAAILSSNLANILISLSIRAKNATLAGLIEQSYPIYTVVFTWLLFGETHVTASTMAGSVLIFAGIFVMTYF